jgi:hypothetical protein
MLYLKQVCLLDGPQNKSWKLKRGNWYQKPILQYPDFTKEFILATDASNERPRAVLSRGEIGIDLPIACASRNLNKTEKNYSTTERELLAVVWGVNCAIFISQEIRVSIISSKKVQL